VRIGHLLRSALRPTVLPIIDANMSNSFVETIQRDS